jgi:ssDNA-binding Zn-finger/Zn-ribbon topoisomerase 1
MPHGEVILSKLELRGDGTATCPDCGRRMKLKQSDQGNGLRNFLECVYCHGRMRCNSLGQPIVLSADRITRGLRVEAHRAFQHTYLDPWKIPELGRLIRIPKRNAHRHRMKLINTLRRHAYQWLAQRLGLDRFDCHIGNMNAAQCRNVVTVCENVTPLHILTWSKIDRGRDV